MERCIELAKQLHEALEMENAPEDLLELSNGLREEIEDEYEDRKEDPETEEEDKENGKEDDKKDYGKMSDEELEKEKDEHLRKGGKPSLVIMIGHKK